MNKIAIFLRDFNKKKTINSDPFNLKQIRSTLVFTNHNIPLDAMQNLGKVTVLFYSEDKDVPRTFIPTAKEDFSWLGKCKNPQIKDILEDHYDLFIDFHDEENKFTHYIYGLFDASAKISFSPKKWADLVILQSKNAEDYFQKIHQMIHKL